jgi:hypothetical protein
MACEGSSLDAKNEVDPSRPPRGTGGRTQGSAGSSGQASTPAGGTESGSAGTGGIGTGGTSSGGSAGADHGPTSAGSAGQAATEFWPKPYDPTCTSATDDISKLLNPDVPNMPGLICGDCHDRSKPNSTQKVTRFWAMAGTITAAPIPPKPSPGQPYDWQKHGVEHVEVGVRVKTTNQFFSACSTDYGAFFLDDGAVGSGGIDWANAEVRVRLGDTEVTAPRESCGAYNPKSRGFCNYCHSMVKRPGAASPLGYLVPPTR